MQKKFTCLLLVLFCHQIAFSAFINVPPQANYDFPQYITSLNYPYEEHQIVTQDGYILTYFRIQKKNSTIQSGLPVVLVHHGLLDSADSFIINDEDEAPALILANLGYDVWLGNSRGNKYGLGHQTLNSSDPESAFWDFSFQEMSLYDLPTGFEYVSSYTGQIVNYIGHSQGTTIMIAALARRDPTILQYLDKFIALAPVAFAGNSTSPLTNIGKWISEGQLLKDYEDLMNRKMFGFESTTTKHLMEDLCAVALELCVIKLRLISDVKTNIDNTKLLVITQGHFPAGTSIQNMLYWSQMSENGQTFKWYDYGEQGNLEHYNSTTPPVYDLTQIKEPVYLFAGEYDELARPADTEALRDRLTGSSHVFYQLYPLGHSTFVYGKDVAGYFQDVLTILASS